MMNIEQTWTLCKRVLPESFKTLTRNIDHVGTRTNILHMWHTKHTTNKLLEGTKEHFLLPFSSRCYTPKKNFYHFLSCTLVARSVLNCSSTTFSLVFFPFIPNKIINIHTHTHKHRVSRHCRYNCFKLVIIIFFSTFSFFWSSILFPTKECAKL